MSTSDPSTSAVTNRPGSIFICSAGHSGSTLLDLLLGSHSSAVSLGEITQLPKNLALNTLCTCGRPVRECAVWSAVVARLRLEPAFAGLEHDPYALFLGLYEAGSVIDRKHQTRLRMLYRRFVYGGAYACWRWPAPVLASCTAPLLRGARNKLILFDILAELRGCRWVVDSSKHYLEAVSMHVAAPERTRVLLLVRDGRAVFHAGLKRGRPRRDALNAWLRTYRRALPLLRRHVSADSLRLVRYEALASDTARELQDVCEFIGLRYEPDMLEFRSKAHHVVNGNDMRFKSGSAIRMDEEWKLRLSAADLAWFEARGGELNRELGYV